MKRLIVVLGFILLVNISYADEGFYMYCTQDSNQQIKCEPVQNVINTNQNNINDNQNNVQQPYRTQSSIQTTAQNTSGAINDISNAIYSLQSMIDTIKNF